MEHANNHQNCLLYFSSVKSIIYARTNHGRNDGGE